MYKGCHMIFFLLYLTYFTQYDTLWVHPCCFKWHYFILFNGWIIFHRIYVPHLHYPVIYQLTFRLLPCLGYCKQCFSERWGTRILWIIFFSGYIPRSGSAASYGSPSFSSLRGTSILFSIVAVPIYIPTNSVGGFPSLQTLCSIFVCGFFF